MLNYITIMGRLCADPEVKATATTGTSVVNILIAVDRDRPDKDGNRVADFFDCVAWGATADFIGKYFRKGSMIIVSGSLHTSNWEDNNGTKRKDYQIRIDNVYFGEAKRSDE